MSAHKGRPGGLQPIINRLAVMGGTVITWYMENHAVPITRFGLAYLRARRHGAMLREIIQVYSACLEWCQLDAEGLISVPCGSKPGTRETIYLPITKCRRCDTEEGDKDYMQGLAMLAGVSVRCFYSILDFLRTLGLIEHSGYTSHPNKDMHSIRISNYRIPLSVRTGLFKMCALPLVWRDRYEKKIAKVEARGTSEPAPPRPPLFKAGVPSHISETVSAKAQEIMEAIKSTRERTPEERYDELQAFGRCLIPQGP